MFDFEKNKSVTTLTDVPDNLHCFYEKQDKDKDDSPFTLKQNDPVVSAAVAVTMGAKGALEKERAAKPVQVDFAPLADYGTDIESIVAGVGKKVTDLEAQVKDGGAVKNQIETLKTELNTSHAQVVGAKDKTIEQLTGQLDTLNITTRIAEGAATITGLNAKLVTPFVQQRMKIEVNAETGERLPVITNADGSTMYSMDRPGEKANVAELLGTMSKDEAFQQLFPSKARSGADNRPGNALKGNPGTGEVKTANDKITSGLESRMK